MKLGKKIAEFSDDRKISFDGTCYHLRLPLEIMKMLQQNFAVTDSVLLKGAWKDETGIHVVLTFSSKEKTTPQKEIKEALEETDEDDYVVLK